MSEQVDPYTIDDLKDDIARVIEYSLEDEEHDFEVQQQEGNGTDGHIVHTLRRLEVFVT